MGRAHRAGETRRLTPLRLTRLFTAGRGLTVVCVSNTSRTVDELIRAVARRGGVEPVPGESLYDALRRAARALRDTTTTTFPPPSDDQTQQETM